MKTLDKEDLKTMLDQNENFVLINVLSLHNFRREHIPGSINIPIDEDFKQEVEERLPEGNEKIVVYCASSSCNASPSAAKKLQELGYTNVYDYEGGIKEWKKEGYPLESSD